MVKPLATKLDNLSWIPELMKRWKNRTSYMELCSAPPHTRVRTSYTITIIQIINAFKNIRYHIWKHVFFLCMKAERWLRAPVSQASADLSSIPRAPKRLETVLCICNPNTPIARWEESQENFSEALRSVRLESSTQQKQDKQTPIVGERLCSF